MTKIADLKTYLMKSQQFRKEYELAEAEYSVIEALIMRTQTTPRQTSQ